MTYSIYQKPCPACGAFVPIESQQCDCGQVFGSADQKQPLPEEQALQEEELFQAYLNARIDQVIQALETARAEFAAESHSRRKLENLILSIQQAIALRDEHEAQAAKISQLQQALSDKTGGAAQQDRPPESFRAQQSAKAEKIMESFNNTQTRNCPHCQTALPVTSVQCLCGYHFARHDFMLPRAADYSTRGEIYRNRE